MGNRGTAMGKFRIGISRDAITANGTVFGEQAFKVLEDPAVEWEFLPQKVAELPPEYGDTYDAICLMSAKVTRKTLSGADRKVRLIARFGVGYDSVDVAACTENGVLLTITPDGVRRPVAASVIGFVLALAHRMFLKDRLTREGRWAEKGNYLGSGLMGRTLGVIGVGNIGREIFKLAQPFGMKLLGCDPNVPQSSVASLGVTMVDKDTLLRQSDYISINTLLDDKTRGLIGAAIDVFEQEPVAPDNPLLKMDNVIVAPHAICHTDECMSLLGQSALKAAVDLAHGRKPHLIVGTQVLRHPAWVGKF